MEKNTYTKNKKKTTSKSKERKKETIKTETKITRTVEIVNVKKE
jgi:hypothetical protein